MQKYQVFGGQYKYYWLGESDTLLGAKHIAETHNEDLDNRGGWHGLEIYDAADCVEVLGIVGLIPHPARRAISIYNRIKGSWEDREGGEKQAKKHCRAADNALSL